MRSWSCQKEACLLCLGRIVGKPEVMAQIGSSGDYFRLARDSGTILEKVLLVCTHKQRSNGPTARLTQCHVPSHMCVPRWQSVVLRFSEWFVGPKVYFVHQHGPAGPFEWPPSLHVR